MSSFLRFTSFLKTLAPWNIAIFIATLIGCYLPQLIITSKWGLDSLLNNPATKHKQQQHEMLMSYMMAFSAGVCFAVSFLFQVNGFQLSISNHTTPVEIGSRCLHAGVILAATFLAFFLLEQSAALIQTWHTRNCAGIPPCAVEVASQPLEAASLVRTIAEHSGMKMEEIRCLALTNEILRDETASSREVIRAEQQQTSYSVPLLDEMRPFTPPRGLRECPLCNRKDLPYNTVEQKSSSWLVLSFLIALFTIHSLTEGLGLGASACPAVDTSAGSTATVAMAILLHKTLSAFAVGAALLKEGISWGVMMLISFGFSIMSPLGSVIGYISCPTHAGDAPINAIFMLLAAGTFLFISLVEFLPKSFDEGSKGPGSISSRLLKTCLFLLGSITISIAEIKAEF